MLVGQPMKILVAYSTAVIECQCEAKSVLVLQGMGRPTPCPACKKLFVIAESGLVKIGQMTVPAAAEIGH